LASAITEFLFAATVIIIAGSFLTRFADAIAELTGLGRLVIGSVLLAGATSLPELTVDISAVRMDLADLAVGDLLGSSLMNLLILAILDLFYRSRGSMLSRQAAAHALSGLVAAGLATIVGLGLLTGTALAPYSIAGVGLGTVLVALGYAFGVRMIFLDQRISIRTATEQPGAAVPPPIHTSLGRNLSGFVVCAAVIFFAGPRLAHAAGTLADLTGLGNTFVGTTLVAFCTSLPELVSMIAALRMGAADLAIGNVFGSNAFNMVLLLPLDIVHRGPLLAAVSPKHAITCLAAILATQVAIMGQLYQVERRARLIEPDAWLVIVIVAAALALIYYLP
jgi:cation:H+ antiporter